MKLSRNEMINQEYVQNLNDEFVEKCRKALEKSYGAAVPVPKCIVKARTFGKEYNNHKRNNLSLILRKAVSSRG